jgi:hypothetical protein
MAGARRPRNTQSQFEDVQRLGLTAPAAAGPDIERQLERFAVILGSLAAERRSLSDGAARWFVYS